MATVAAQLRAGASAPTVVNVPSRRMTLGAVTSGKQDKPPRIVLYGVEGVGKSTFAASAPRPIFLGAEDGLYHLDVQRFPFPRTWNEIREAVHTLTTEPHEFRTFVLDTLDWAEPMLFASICAAEKVDSIEKVGGGYGKGYTAAIDGWRALLADLDRLRNDRGMIVILLAHSKVGKFQNPAGPDFDRYTLKINDKAAGTVKEWADAVFFANHETLTHKEEGTKRVRGVSSGARILYTTRTAAYDAKNRDDLPAKIPLSWPEYATARKARRPADPLALVAAIETDLATLDDAETTKAAKELIAKHEGNAAELAKVLDRVRAKLAA